MFLLTRTFICKTSDLKIVWERVWSGVFAYHTNDIFTCHLLLLGLTTQLMAVISTQRHSADTGQSKTVKDLKEIEGKIGISYKK